tara:strand:- start:46 stop:354 length:309 start_codon:yes stop_codon:yes gene_type:complete
MTQKQIIEQIQQVHPEIGETQLRLMLNSALDEFVSEARTNIHMDIMLNTPTADQRYYDFTEMNDISDAEDVLEVLEVTYGNPTDGEVPIGHYTGVVTPLDVT